jgi:dihydroneopterin triphosphate diphosphatase
MDLGHDELDHGAAGSGSALAVSPTASAETATLSPVLGPTAPTVYKRPQSVLVVICTRGGEFLMLRRTSPRQFWQSVTGSLAPGESPRAAALREVWEETGLRVGSALIDLKRSVLFPIVRAWRERYAPNVCFNREYWFALVLETRRIIRLDANEHLEYRWLSADRAARLCSSWTNRDAIRALAAG